MGFWLLLALFVASTVVSALLQKRPKDVQPAGIGDFTAPTADETRVVPVIWGTVKLSGPNVIWYGDLRLRSIRVRSGLFFTTVIGWKYILGMQLALCHGPIDEFLWLYTGSHPDDKVVPIDSITTRGTGWRLGINQPNFWGGDREGGGMQGTLDLYRGDQTQGSDDYLSAQIVSPAPAYRGLCYAVVRQMYLGTSQYLNNLSFVVRRTPDPLGLGSIQANIFGDANPANILYETLTNNVWGLGRPAASIDIASFRACGHTLWTENLGLSMVLDNTAAADSFMGEVLRHIDGAIYTDPATGLWTMVLARKDYDAGAIPEFTTMDILGEPEFVRGSWEETLNQIAITFIDRSQNFKERTVKADQSANFATRGELASDTIDFKGISNADQALRIALRELRTHSYPLAQLKITVNRKAWKSRIAGVFRFTWQPLGIQDQVFRITSIKYGTLEKGEIEIEAAEDIFATAYTAYEDPGGTGWRDPISAPAVAAGHVLFETPYHLVGDERWITSAVVRGSGLEYGYELWTDDGIGYYKTADEPNFCPSGTLVNAYARTTAATDAVGFLVSGARDLEDVGTTDAAGRSRGTILALIDCEIVSLLGASDNGDGTWTCAGVMRGVLDTLPADHNAGARAYFFSVGAGFVYDYAMYLDASLTCKALPYNQRGTVAVSAATAVAISTASRYSKPYPPGAVKVNGVFWPATTIGDATLTWEHRNRITQRTNNVVIAQDAVGLGYTPEGSGTYSVQVFVGGTLRQSTTTAANATSQVYTALQRAIDDADGTKTVQMRITPVNGTLTGPVRTMDAFTMTGFGLAFGSYFGGGTNA